MIYCIDNTAISMTYELISLWGQHSIDFNSPTELLPALANPVKPKIELICWKFNMDFSTLAKGSFGIQIAHVTITKYSIET